MAIDPFRGYANGVAVHLGRVTVVVDPFHVIALANRAIDDVNRRVQNETLGHRGRSGNPTLTAYPLTLTQTQDGGGAPVSLGTWPDGSPGGSITCPDRTLRLMASAQTTDGITPSAAQRQSALSVAAQRLAAALDCTGFDG